MTNEQLAILIRGYALRLDELIERLDDEIPEGAERHLKWVRKDDGKESSPFDMPRFNQDYEQRAVGGHVCLDGLHQFSAELWAQVDELSAMGKPEVLKRTRARK